MKNVLEITFVLSNCRTGLDGLLILRCWPPPPPSTKSHFIYFFFCHSPSSLAGMAPPLSSTTTKTTTSTTATTASALKKPFPFSLGQATLRGSVLFAGLLGLYSGVRCLAQRVRAKDDVFNAGLGGFVCGNVLGERLVSYFCSDPSGGRCMLFWFAFRCLAVGNRGKEVDCG